MNLKKIAAALAATCVVLFAAAAYADPPHCFELVVEDSNLDGAVNATDILHTARVVVGLEEPTTLYVRPCTGNDEDSDSD